MTGKYDSQRDEVLDAMTLAGWANTTDGDVEEYGLWFALVTNEAADVATVNTEFVSFFEDEGFSFDLSDELAGQLVGSFIVTTNEVGQVLVYPMRDAGAAGHTYSQMQQTYIGWAENR